MSERERERETRSERRELARTLKMIGLLMALLCGLCTTTCAGPEALRVATGRSTDHMSGLVLSIAALIGLLPTVVGVVVFLVGVRLERELKGPPPS